MSERRIFSASNEALECCRQVLAPDPDDEDAAAAIADMEQVLFKFPEA